MGLTTRLHHIELFRTYPENIDLGHDHSTLNITEWFIQSVTIHLIIIVFVMMAVIVITTYIYDISDNYFGTYPHFITKRVYKFEMRGLVMLFWLPLLSK